MWISLKLDKLDHDSDYISLNIEIKTKAGVFEAETKYIIF